MKFVPAPRPAHPTNKGGLSRRRTAFLAGAATLSIALPAVAHAQVIVHAREDRDASTAIELSQGDDRLIVDISRVDASGVLNVDPISTGITNHPGGTDTLWLAARGVQTRALFEDDFSVANFSGGIVYEAYGAGSVLTLTPPPSQSYDQTLRLAGNGTINLTANQAPIGFTQAISVEEDSTARRFDGEDGRLTLNVSGIINGADAEAHVDVQHAASLNLVGATIDVRRGIAIYGTDQAITIDAQSQLRAKDSDSLNVQDATLVYLDGEGTVTNYGRILEQGDVGGPGSTPDEVATGVFLNGGGALHNARTSATSFGSITMHGNAVVLEGDGGTIINDGLIQSDKTAAQAETYAAISSRFGRVGTESTLRNNAGGTVQGIITNTNGDNLGYTTAYEGGLGIDLVVNAGTINGDVTLDGDTTQNRRAWQGDAFLTAGTGTVTGQIDGGIGDHDAYGRSLAANGTYAVSNVLGTAQTVGFERHGLEAFGADVTATFTSNEVLGNGLTLLGNGTILNQADITLGDSIGIVVHEFANSLDFVNDTGAVVSVGNGKAFRSGEDGLASFTNRGTFTSAAREFSDGTVDIFAVDRLDPFVFNNSGTITNNSTGGAVKMVVDGDTTTMGGDLEFTNSGQIRGGSVGADIEIYARGHGLLNNSGSIEGSDFGLQFDGGELTATNTGTLRGTGNGGTGWGIDSPNTVVTNNGTIEATGAGIDDPNLVELSAGLVVGLNTGGTANITNGANGVISATQARSVAVVADGISSPFTFTNSGRVVGSGTDTIALDRLIAGDRAFLQGTVASAIHTEGTVDLIVNRDAGVIQGNVDLGSEDDRFEARGTSRLEGDLRLGRGDDTVFLAGGTITGAVAGGTGTDDTIAVDLSVAEQTISAGQYSGFENINREVGGNGIVNILGVFDAASLNIRGVTLRVRQGTAVGTTGDRTFDGSDEAERLIVEGTVNEAVRLSGGDDRVEMGDSGTISGELDMGAGNDTLVLGTGSTITGAVDGGEDANGLDNDIIGFELTQDMNSVPGIVSDALNFETIQVSGDHRLTLALGQSYEAISLINGADLDLTIADGVTVGRITGDATSQNVTITGDLTGGVSLGGGNDMLTMNGFEGVLSSVLDGGEDAGGLDNDILNLNIIGTTTFGNGASGFETINVDGTAQLIIDGDFAAGQTLNFGAGDNHLVIASGAEFGGTVNGGAGGDRMTVATDAPDSRTLVSAQINGFETLDVEGDGTLALTGGDYSFANGVNVTEGGNLELGANTHLTANITFTAAFDDRLTLSTGSRITGGVDAGDRAGDRDVLAFQQAGGQISRLGAFGLSTLTGFEQMAVLGAGEFHIDQNLAAFDEVVLEGGNLVVDAGSTLTADVVGRDVADPAQAASDDRLNVQGVVQGNVALGGGNDIVDNRGRIAGNVDLGAGDDRYIARDGGVVTGTIDGGAGDNTFIFRLGGQDGSIPGNVANFNSIGVYGAGTLEIALAAGQRYENFELLEGANLSITEDLGGSIGTIIGDASAQEVTIGSTLTGGVNLGGGDDTLNLTLDGILSGSLLGGENADGSADADGLNLTLGGDSQIGGMNEFETVRVTAADGVRLTVTGAVGAGQSITFEGATNNELALTAGATLQGFVDGGAGDDLLEIETGGVDQRTVIAAQIRNFENLVSNGTGTLALTGGSYSFDSLAVNGGNLELGANSQLGVADGILFDGADNRFTIRDGAEVSGTIDGGAGNDTLALVQGPQFARLLSLVQATGFERLEASGNGVLRIDRNATFTGGVGLDGGTTRVDAGNALTADVTGGNNADTLEVFGSIVGNVDLGAGNDRLVINSLTGISGAVNGGADLDTVVFDTNATYAAPLQVAGNLFQGFENLGINRGVVGMTGTSAWTNINVAGGRLIGQAGSTINADLVTVALGGTFGSAGIVNGDIDVFGTLSPGASPGTMTVNGDVTMRAGSNLLIELTPNAGNDLLDVNGTLTIADGATMDITGALGNLPGSVLDIVVADAITGRFTTINKSASVFGFVVQNGNRIQIRSEFNNSNAFPTNVQASVAYSNQVLRASYGVQAYTAALNVLTAADGTINQRAFAQLTPEAYGSAMQAGLENGLQLIDVGRTLRLTAPKANGLYGFAQGLTGGSDIRGQADTGTSRADLRTNGMLGGIGYGMADGQLRVGAFIGRSDTDQRLVALDATTKAKGFLGGVFADAAIGDLGVHAMVSYSDLDAETRRNLMASRTLAQSEYGLKSWVADVSVDYSAKIGGINVTPKIGLSHVSTSRGAVVEQGAGAFDLAVAGDRDSAWLADVGVAFSGTVELAGATLTPYAEVGARQMLNNADILVTGRFDGAPGAPIVVNGVERDKTVGRLGLGVGARLSENVHVRVGYTGEFSNTKRSSVAVGASIRF
ncbi:Outer membrane autotransporter barrel domain-containing protein [Sphingopyxis sp. LC81]|uniref:autotransporter domain-containing protein n=1 Tax=Sphingopyxis sp. LC81 TaxID=1502850 RepID=UPI00050EA93B|nr:autotransporter outer membrane beta-barrel domain-containing protein [Sphingopyxis sp. LC81]KGB53954.1 Outer membrane autotransporter barrel domain-containing protein [Sphingopyxis sp. LC81]